jgi:hypothetical protein
MTCIHHSATIFVGAAIEVEALKKALAEAQKKAAEEHSV